ncbi:MAG: GNAT family N-acetyltransferase [Candidatus Nanopelagicales bacterium]
MAEWRYGGPWAVYDGDGTPPGTDGYWAVVDHDEQFVGYYCTGPEARVPGLDGQSDTLDLGVGMRPDLVGAGNGREFAKAVMAHCRQSHQDERVRAVVQSWNERSLRLAASVGFEVAGTHACVQDGKTVTYTVLLAYLHPTVSASSCPLPP